MKNITFYILASLFMTSAVLGSQSTPDANRYAKDARSKTLEAQKGLLNPDALERMDIRAKGRSIQAKGDVVVDITSEIKTMIRNAPLSVQQQNPTTVIAILNQVVQGAGITIRAYGRRKEALQAIMDTNEQILEAAARSYEKIQGLTTLLDKLIGPATVQSAFQKIKTSENLSKARKLLTIMNPNNYLNTFNNFTDSLYITDNKAERWEKIKEATKALTEEQARFDDYIALLELKVLENMMMEYHRIDNLNKVNKPVNTKVGTAGYNPDQSNVGYIDVLDASAHTLDEAIAVTDSKILELQDQAPKRGFLNHLKKVVGKDADTQKNNNLDALRAEREKYVKQKQDVENKIAHYQSLKLNPEQIADARADLLAKINEVQAQRASKINIKDLSEAIMELKSEVLKLQNDIKGLTKAPPLDPIDSSQKPKPAPIQPTNKPAAGISATGKVASKTENPAYQPASHFYPKLSVR